MNERIKELWENCEDIQVVYPRQGSPIYASPELLEKFAELIVKECADYVREEYDHEHAEGIAWNMEIKFGLHGDYA